jgi:hypothetical protein
MISGGGSLPHTSSSSSVSCMLIPEPSHGRNPVIRRLLCLIGRHDYTPWRIHDGPCIAGMSHSVRRCRRRGCIGGSFYRRNRLL